MKMEEPEQQMITEENVKEFRNDRITDEEDEATDVRT